jgi:hypothetical protein
VKQQAEPGSHNTPAHGTPPIDRRIRLVGLYRLDGAGEFSNENGTRMMRIRPRMNTDQNID